MLKKRKSKESNKIRILFYLNEHQIPYSSHFNDYITNKFLIIKSSNLTHPRNDGLNGITLFIKRELVQHEFIYIIKKVFRYFIKGSNINNNQHQMDFYYKDSVNDYNNLDYSISKNNF